MIDLYVLPYCQAVSCRSGHVILQLCCNFIQTINKCREVSLVVDLLVGYDTKMQHLICLADTEHPLHWAVISLWTNNDIKAIIACIFKYLFHRNNDLYFIISNYFAAHQAWRCEMSMVELTMIPLGGTSWAVYDLISWYSTYIYIANRIFL